MNTSSTFISHFYQINHLELSHMKRTNIINIVRELICTYAEPPLMPSDDNKKNESYHLGKDDSLIISWISGIPMEEV